MSRYLVTRTECVTRKWVVVGEDEKEARLNAMSQWHDPDSAEYFSVPDTIVTKLSDGPKLAMTNIIPRDNKIRISKVVGWLAKLTLLQVVAFAVIYFVVQNSSYAMRH